MCSDNVAIIPCSGTRPRRSATQSTRSMTVSVPTSRSAGESSTMATRLSITRTEQPHKRPKSKAERKMPYQKETQTQKKYGREESVKRIVARPRHRTSNRHREKEQWPQTRTAIAARQKHKTRWRWHTFTSDRRTVFGERTKRMPQLQALFYNHHHPIVGHQHVRWVAIQKANQLRARRRHHGRPRTEWGQFGVDSSVRRWRQRRRSRRSCRDRLKPLHR